jgi:hypothetical protein
MRYDPQSALDSDSIMVVHPVKNSETFANDCIVKALNFMLRSHYFTHQLQVLRLAVRNLKVSKAEVNKLKLAGGIRANAFYEEFLIKQDKAYRLYRVIWMSMAASRDTFQEEISGNSSETSSRTNCSQSGASSTMRSS